MALRRSGNRSSFKRSSGRKMSGWAGVTSATPSTIASAGTLVVEVVSAAVLAEVGIQGYIARTRGWIGVLPSTQGDDPIVTFGIGVFNSGQATGLPLPASETRDPYMAWGAVFGGTATSDNMTAGNIIRIDSKGKRRFDADDRVILSTSSKSHRSASSL